MHLKRLITATILIFSVTLHLKAQEEPTKVAINKDLDTWHKAAATANFDAYFNLMTTDAVFIGTDATEHWGVQAFKAYCKPHFDKGAAWDFTALERHIFVENDKIAWFDELLETHMGICRGSGVLRFEDNHWKVAHYVLSMTVPNENMRDVADLKLKTDAAITKSLLD